MKWLSHMLASFAPKQRGKVRSFVRRRFWLKKCTALGGGQNARPDDDADQVSLPASFADPPTARLARLIGFVFVVNQSKCNSQQVRHTLFARGMLGLFSIRFRIKRRID